MRIPRFLVTVPYLHSYDLSDLFYHNGRGMVKLTRIRFQILCVVVVLVLNITVRQSRQSGVARATCPD